MMMSYRMLLLATVISIAGCGGGGGVPENQPPTISAVTVAPTNVAFIGGTVTITAQVTDDDTVATVSAEVAGPGADPDTVSLSLDGEEYSGDYVADKNLEPEEDVYTVTVTATDNKGEKTDSEMKDFKVAGLPTPPPPPPAFQP